MLIYHSNLLVSHTRLPLWYALCLFFDWWLSIAQKMRAQNTLELCVYFYIVAATAVSKCYTKLYVSPCTTVHGRLMGRSIRCLKSPLTHLYFLCNSLFWLTSKSALMALWNLYGHIFIWNCSMQQTVSFILLMFVHLWELRYIIFLWATGLFIYA